jgi:ribosomal protein S19
MFVKNIKKFTCTRTKIQHLNYESVLLYLRKMLFSEQNNKLIFHRTVKISSIFKAAQAYTYQGRTNVRVPLTPHRTGFCMGMFAATKKPFNYRPKVKKQKR